VSGSRVPHAVLFRPGAAACAAAGRWRLSLTIGSIWHSNRFFIYCNEGNEPKHIHVASANGVANFWTKPLILGSAAGLAAHEISAMRRIVDSRLTEIKERWNEHSRQD
jgi:hypothetical protein